MDTKHLKAAAQLAEMHHNADPKNEGKKHEYEKAQSAYEEAAEADFADKTEVAPSGESEAIIKDAGELSIEALEALLLKAKGALKNNTAEAEQKAATEATEAATLAANAGAKEGEDLKKKRESELSNPAQVVEEDRNERLSMQAESLHKEAALLSNSLADFAEVDVEGRKPIVDKILELREAWKDARHELETGQLRRPPLERDQKPTEARLGMSESEIKVELQKNRVNISKNKRKIEATPEHKNRPTWEADLARLEAINNDYETELIRLKYETA